jgi:rubrerythrin
MLMFVKGPTTVKKIVVNVCRDCGNSFRGHSGSYRCPECRKKEEQYKAQREKMRRALPYYLRTGS